MVLETALGTAALAQSAAAPAFMASLSKALPFVNSLSGLFGGSSGPKQPSFQDQVDVQKQFARTAIQWRVEDALRSGIHPLYAIGAPAVSFSPVSVGGSDGPSPGERFQAFGQNLERAVSATQNSGERTNSRLMALSLERGELENTLLRTQIASQMARLQSDQVGPPMAGSNYTMPGQTSSGVLVNPSETTTVGPDASIERAVGPANKLFLNRDGTLSVWPSKEAKESIEDSWYEYEHMWRNRVLPYLQRGAKATAYNFGFRSTPY